MYIKFYLKRPNADRESVLFVRITYSKTSLKYYISEKIAPKYWDSVKQRAKSVYPEKLEFNSRLKSIETDIGTIYSNYLLNNNNKQPTEKKFREILDQKLKPTSIEKNSNLFAYYDSFINKMKTAEVNVNGVKYKPSTIQIYQNTLNRLKAFEKDKKRKIDFNSIDMIFYREFTGYLTAKLKLAPNTIGKDIKTIKAIMSSALEDELHDNYKFKSKKFKTIKSETEDIYLNEIELAEIEELDLNPTLNRVRDLFLIGCYTGLRYSDFTNLSSANIQGNFLKVDQVKKGVNKDAKIVLVPILEGLKRVMDRHDGGFPLPMSNQKMNIYLKELCEKVKLLQKEVSIKSIKGGVEEHNNFPKYKLVSTHTARRSFATNQYHSGLGVITIMNITGHKTERDFLRYIKATPIEHAEKMRTHNLKAV
jgi:integrase